MHGGRLHSIEDLKAQTDISKIIGSRIELVRSGSRLKGLCPFHDENTPSFTVDSENGFYHCFGCGAHGDVFDFVQQYERKNSFMEAVQAVCQESGINFSPANLPRLPTQPGKQITLLGIMEAFTLWCTKQLTTTIEGYRALEYLRERGVSDKSIAQFKLGYCPEKYESLALLLQQNDYNLEDVTELGIIRNQRSVFGGRIIFPIHNEDGGVIAVGARTMGAKNPKYINSKENLLFKKNEHFYAIHLAMAQRAKELVVVEGYLDTIMLHQEGIGGAVATMGTAFSREQIKKLWKKVPYIRICFDGDAAGAAAMDKAAIEATISIDSVDKKMTFIELENGFDPADAIIRYGPGLFSRGTDLAERVFAAVSRGTNMQLPGGRARAEKRFLDIVAQMSNKLLAKHYKQYFYNRIYGKKKIESEQQTQSPQAMEKLSDRICVLQIAITIKNPSILSNPDFEEDFVLIDTNNQELRNIKDFILDKFHENRYLQASELLLDLGHAFSVSTLGPILEVMRVLCDSTFNREPDHLLKVTSLWRELVSHETELCATGSGGSVADAVRRGDVAARKISVLKEISRLMCEVFV